MFSENNSLQYCCLINNILPFCCLKKTKWKGSFGALGGIKDFLKIFVKKTAQEFLGLR